MKIKLNKTFSSREELDNFVRTSFGEDPIENKDIVLELSPEELASLSLSESSKVYGAKIKKEVK